MNNRTFLERIYLSVYPSFWPLWLGIVVATLTAHVLSFKDYVFVIACIPAIILSISFLVLAKEKFVYSPTKLILAKNTDGDLELIKKILKREEYVILNIDREREFQIEIPLSTGKKGLRAIINCKAWLPSEIDWLDFLSLEEIFGVWQKDKKNEYLSLIEKFAVQPIKGAIEKSGMSSLLVKGFIDEEKEINGSDLLEGLLRQLHDKHFEKFMFLPKIKSGILIMR